MTEILITPDNTKAIKAVDSKESKHVSLTELLIVERGLQSTFGAIVSEPVEANCHLDFKAAHTSGKRPLYVIDKVVVHSTEGGTARSVARYFTDDASGGSTQLVVDDNTCYRCLSDDEIAWAAPGANYDGFHIEQCGYAKWTATVWSKTHRKTLQRAAFKTALHCLRYGIPIRFLTADMMKRGVKKGITTHAECTKAFGGSHTDPGAGWPRLLFMTMVRGYAAVLKVKQLA